MFRLISKQNDMCDDFQPVTLASVCRLAWCKNIKTEIRSNPGFQHLSTIKYAGVFPIPEKSLCEKKTSRKSRRLPNGAMVSHPDLVSQDSHAPACPPGFVGEVSVICTAAAWDGWPMMAKVQKEHILFFAHWSGILYKKLSGRWC